MWARHLRRQLCLVPKADCFALLQTERRFDLEATQLHRSYKVLMAEAHPDRYGTHGEEAQREAGERASLITDAYTTLRSPHRRPELPQLFAACCMT
mmetsp:Transcript_46048/g.103754  ORF Transcript_46048/g.103754 Transcript_46048/m.103754 type:complete len:96 (+) Transcript_46048:22-309(+)